MSTPNDHPLKLKAILLSSDGGKTWIVSRQYYVVDLKTNEFTTISLKGEVLISKSKGADRDQE